MSNQINRIGLACAGAIALYLAVIDVQTWLHNTDLEAQIAIVTTDVELQTLERDLAHDQIQYYRTDSYRDREARAKLGLQLAGESVIIVP